MTSTRDVVAAVALSVWLFLMYCAQPGSSESVAADVHTICSGLLVLGIACLLIVEAVLVSGDKAGGWYKLERSKGRSPQNHGVCRFLHRMADASGRG